MRTGIGRSAIRGIVSSGEGAMFTRRHRRLNYRRGAARRGSGIVHGRREGTTEHRRRVVAGERQATDYGRHLLNEILQAAGI